jgi:hypothetical protein
MLGATRILRVSQIYLICSSSKRPKTRDRACYRYVNVHGQYFSASLERPARKSIYSPSTNHENTQSMSSNLSWLLINSLAKIDSNLEFDFEELRTGSTSIAQTTHTWHQVTRGVYFECATFRLESRTQHQR